MTRETSTAAYHQILAEGLIKGLQLEVYEYLFSHGPATQMEVCRGIRHPSRQDRSYMPRFAELERMGVIKTMRTRFCKITGREVLEWDVTDALPTRDKKARKAIYRHWCDRCDRSFDQKPQTHKIIADDLFSPICMGTVTKWKKCG